MAGSASVSVSLPRSPDDQHPTQSNPHHHNHSHRAKQRTVMSARHNNHHHDEIPPAPKNSPWNRTRQYYTTAPSTTTTTDTATNRLSSGAYWYVPPPSYSCALPRSRADLRYGTGLPNMPQPAPEYSDCSLHSADTALRHNIRPVPTALVIDDHHHHCDGILVSDKAIPDPSNTGSPASALLATPRPPIGGGQPREERRKRGGRAKTGVRAPACAAGGRPRQRHGRDRCLCLVLHRDPVGRHQRGVGRRVPLLPVCHTPLGRVPALCPAAAAVWGL